MSILDCFRRKPEPTPSPYTPPPPPKMISETFRLDDQDQVILEARSLLDLKRVEPRAQDVRSIVARVKNSEARQSEDGAKVDNDPRPGHVLTPDFSYHQDTGKFRLTGDRAIEGDPHKATYKDWFESAVWDRQQHTVTLTYQEGAMGSPQSSGLPPRVTPRKHEILSQQSYTPDAAPQRVQDLLEAASLWQKQGLALDALPGVDFHPDSGRVVAPQVPPEQIQGTARLQLLVGQSRGCEMLKMHVDGENLQLKGFSPTGAPVQLGATRDAEGNYEVTFLQDSTYHNPDNSAERVIISKDTGALVYQTLKYTDPDGQYA